MRGGWKRTRDGSFVPTCMSYNGTAILHSAFRWVQPRVGGSPRAAHFMEDEFGKPCLTRTPCCRRPLCPGITDPESLNPALGHAMMAPKAAMKDGTRHRTSGSTPHIQRHRSLLLASRMRRFVTLGSSTPSSHCGSLKSLFTTRLRMAVSQQGRVSMEPSSTLHFSARRTCLLDLGRVHARRKLAQRTFQDHTLYLIIVKFPTHRPQSRGTGRSRRPNNCCSWRGTQFGIHEEEPPPSPVGAQEGKTSDLCRTVSLWTLDRGRSAFINE
ncbi:hypothetical protein HD554DRAFT_1547823 [Boletus coccyginus]|nr:hypothetical protein HD554DRAFT_1547823 [Boletus coccyginus]